MTDTFKASGVITVTTDFGHRGPFVGTMKGVMLTRFPAARIVDLTHEAFVHWPAEAGFWITRSYRYFPPGTVHLAVVDPGVGTDRNILLVVGAGHTFLAPDNGLLADVIEQTEATAYQLDAEVVERHKLDDLSATFHGRDIFAPLAAAIASGSTAPETLGRVSHDYIPSVIEPPEQRGAKLVGVVVTADHFGNLITNIDRRELEGFQEPVVYAGGHEIPLGRTYADASPGDLIALVNSFNVVEIARAEQNAADFLNIGRGAPIVIAELA